MSATNEVRASSLLSLLRDAYLRRRSGRLVATARRQGIREIYVRRGELFLDRDSEPASQLGETVARAGELDRPMADDGVREAVEKLAADFLGSGAEEPTAEWKKDAPAGVELIGPLPAIGFLLAAAAHGGDERRLLDRLGGTSARLVTRDDTPATRQLPGLDPDMARVLVLLQQPTTVAEVLRGGGDRLATLTGLVRLWSVGLVGGPDEGGNDAEEVVSPKILDRFLSRIGEAIEGEPIEVEASEHRSQLAELFGRLGELDHYQLLGLGARAEEAEIPAAYDRLARWVHPSHAERLGWAGNEGTLKVLFERATEAYLTLSDPVRRSSYNNLMGLHSKVEIDEEKRDEEKRFVARQNYLQATTSLAEADYSTAVDLLKESVRIDPQAEYFALLGQAQAKNPHWRRHAVETYRKAAELKPDDAGIQLAFAKVLEAEEHLDEAREHYGIAADLMPDNIDAQEALVRLGGASAQVREVGQSLRSVLGRRRR